MSESQRPTEARDAVGTEDEAAHDVLAAEAFAMPAPDPTLHHGPVVLPDDPAGIVEPHDVLAAEEFPMPAPRTTHPDGRGRPVKASHRIGIAAAVGFLALLVRRVRRRRRQDAG
jgi:hypothetical protein